MFKAGYLTVLGVGWIEDEAHWENHLFIHVNSKFSFNIWYPPEDGHL
jgi:hypothetical protein